MSEEGVVITDPVDPSVRTVGLVEVSDVFVAADRTPLRGAVFFAPMVAAVDDDPERAVVTRATVRAELDEAGAFTALVTASDDDGWFTDGPVPYCITVTVTGLQQTYTALIPGPGPWRLTDLIVLDAPPDVAVIPTPGGEGPPGPPPTLVDGTTTTLEPGSPATGDVVPTGAPGEYRIDLGVPAGGVGPAPVLVDGETETLPPGSDATHDVVEVGPGIYRLDLGIPHGGDGEPGDPGPPPTLVDGTTATLPPGSPATHDVVPTGTPGEYRIDMGIPAGAAGADSVVPGPPGPEGPPGGGTQQSVWNWYAAATTGSAIASGRVGVNHDSPAAATQLRIHRLGQLNGIDWSVTIAGMRAGDHIYLQAKANALSFHRYVLTGVPTASGDNWLIPVVTDSGSPQGTEPANGADVLVAFQFQPPGGAVPAGGTTGQVLAKTSGADYAVAFVDPPAGLQSRTTATITTASLAAGASESGSVPLAKGYRLLRLQTDRPARVRLYGTAAARDADASRPVGTDPTGNHSLMLEFVTTASLLAADLSPTVDGFNGDTTPGTAAYYRITNQDSSSGTVGVSLTWIQTEG